MKEQELIKFVLGIISAAAGSVAFTYSTFTTKDYVKEAVIQRLDRIEVKLDRLMENQDKIEIYRKKQSKSKREYQDIDYD